MEVKERSVDAVETALSKKERGLQRLSFSLKSAGKSFKEREVKGKENTNR